MRRLVLAVVVAGLAASGAQAGDAAAGRKLVSGQCMTCHGMDGIAQIPIAPHLAGENEIYLITQLKAFRSGKREHEIMSVVAAGLSDADMDNVAAWYAAVKITAEIPK